LAEASAAVEVILDPVVTSTKTGDAAAMPAASTRRSAGTPDGPMVLLTVSRSPGYLLMRVRESRGRTLLPTTTGRRPRRAALNADSERASVEIDLDARGLGWHPDASGPHLSTNLTGHPGDVKRRSRV
jgi:hypothetical protein